MNSGDFLNFSLGIGFLVLVAFICYSIYHFVKVLETTNILLQDVDSLTEDIGEGIKNNPLVKFLGFFKSKKESRRSED